jgi:hypothetical protein
MVTKAEVQKVDCFLRGLSALCREHRAVFNGSVSLLVDAIPVYASEGFSGTVRDICLEVGPISDSEIWVFLPMEPPMTTGTNGVFNSAGVDNPLP